jgi:hypothetical protein
MQDACLPARRPRGTPPPPPPLLLYTHVGNDQQHYNSSIRNHMRFSPVNMAPGCADPTGGQKYRRCRLLSNDRLD